MLSKKRITYSGTTRKEVRVIEIEIIIRYASDLEEGKLKKLLKRVADETKEYPHVKVKICIT